MSDTKNKVNIDDKLFLNTYNVDTTSHLAIRDAKICENCREKICTNICPAHVYQWKDGHTIVYMKTTCYAGVFRIA